MAIHEVVNMVSVRYCLVAAARTVDMTRIVSFAGVARGTGGRIGLADLHCVLFDLAVGTYVMQVAVMQIVNMITVLNSGVLAVWAVIVVVIAV